MNQSRIYRSSKKQLQSGELITSSDSVEAEYLCGEDIGYPRVVMLVGNRVMLFHQSNENNIYRAIGISKYSAVAGERVGIVLSGAARTGNSLTGDARYYAGDNGLMLKDPPETGIILQLGVAKNIDIMLVKFSNPYISI